MIESTDGNCGTASSNARANICKKGQSLDMDCRGTVKTYRFVRALYRCCFAGSGLDASHDDIAIRRRVLRSMVGGKQDEEWGRRESGGCLMMDVKQEK